MPEVSFPCQHQTGYRPNSIFSHVVSHVSGQNKQKGIQQEKKAVPIITSAINVYISLFVLLTFPVPCPYEV